MLVFSGLKLLPARQFYCTRRQFVRPGDENRLQRQNGVKSCLKLD